MTEVKHALLLSEFKKAIKERIKDGDLSWMYQKLFFEFFISEEDLSERLEHYRKIFLKRPQSWFAEFHKSIRVNDFFDGRYAKFVDTLTEEQRKRRKEIIDLRMKWRRSNTDQEPPHTQELRNLNSLMDTPEDVPVAGIADAFLYSLIHVDKENELMKAMEIAFKICS